MRYLPLLLVLIVCLVLGGGMAAIAAPVPPCQFWEVCSVQKSTRIPEVDLFPILLFTIIVLTLITVVLLRFTRKGK